MSEGKEAMLWERLNDDVRCMLCNHHCTIPPGKTGICAVRKNVDGALRTLIYGMTSSIAVDPIEKKPLFHFCPGTDVLSLGTVGCNFRCLHCQNYTISMARVGDIPLYSISPDYVVEQAKRTGCRGVAWTYNEPTIWFEFTYDSSKIAKDNGLYSVYVTNGYMSEEALQEIAPYLDAMNIDVKAFNDEFYRKICGGAHLEPVLDTCVMAKSMGIHIELTYLIIPDYNDTEREIRNFARWVVETLGPDIPCHFTRFYPHYKMLDLPPTPMKRLNMAYNLAKEEGINYVYLGNIPHNEKENTYCHNCGKLLIERWGFNVVKYVIKDGKCPYCGSVIPGVFNH